MDNKLRICYNCILGSSGGLTVVIFLISVIDEMKTSPNICKEKSEKTTKNQIKKGVRRHIVDSRAPFCDKSIENEN